MYQYQYPYIIMYQFLFSRKLNFQKHKKRKHIIIFLFQYILRTLIHFRQTLPFLFFNKKYRLIIFVILNFRFVYLLFFLFLFLLGDLAEFWDRLDSDFFSKEALSEFQSDDCGFDSFFN